MADFNPDAYLAEKAPDTSGFDPDAYLASKTTAMGAAGRGALDALPFGDKAAAKIQEAVNPAGGNYSSYLAELDKLLSADKEQHPVAHYAGETAGTVAPLAIPGVGEALTGESLAGRMAIGAGLGGAQGASNNRDPNTLVSDTLKGAGVGAVAQPLVGALGDAVEGAANGAIGSKLGNRASATLFTQTNGLNPMALRKIASAAGEDPETAVNVMAAKLKEIVPPNYYSPTSSINEKYAMLNDIKNKAGAVIGAARKEAATQELPEAQEAIHDLIHQAENWQDVANPEGADNIKNAAAMLQAIKNKGQLNFDTMQAIKSKVGEGFNNPNTIKPGTSEIYGTISTHLDKALDRMAPTNPNIDPAAFADAKAKYALTSKIMPLMMRGAGREVNAAMSPLKAAMGLGSMAVGHPAGAAVTALKAGQELGAPELGANVAMMARNALADGSHIPTAPIGALAASAAPQGLDFNHPALRQFKPQFDAALQGVSDPAQREKTVAATDYVLQQNNPAYAKAKQEASGN